MTFLYPYTLLARGWGEEHRRLKNSDLATSMFLPFVLATSLVIVACANTLHVQGIRVQGAVDAAHALQPLVGLTFGRLIFSLGILSMCLTTLVIEMVICGFVLSEIFRFECRGWAYRASTMLANIGILGAFYKMPFWLPVQGFTIYPIPLGLIYSFSYKKERDFICAEDSFTFCSFYLF